MTKDVIIALSSALSNVIQARGVLARAQTSLEYLERAPALFTRAQAIAEATEKLKEFGPLGQTALRSLIAQWQEAERATIDACPRTSSNRQ